MQEHQNHPTFAIDGDVIPVLALICALCKDRETRIRAVHALRSLRRREGVWDSRQVADGCEVMIMGRSATTALPYHLPKGLRRLWQ